MIVRDTNYDLAIVGSGSAAFAGAIRARNHGASVLMVESGTIGGTCVNVGCVPSKFVLRAAELRHEIGSQNGAGDLSATIDGKDRLVGALRKTKYEELVERYGFTLRKGTGRFADAQTLLVDGEPVRAKNYLIATGSVPSVPAIPGLNEAGFLTSTTALNLRTAPQRLAVVGGSAIGLELGQYFARMGSAVTVLEALDRIAPFDEPEIGEALATALNREGIEIRTGARVVSFSREGTHKNVRFTTSDGETTTFAFDEILIATGRTPNTQDLNLEGAGIATTERGGIVVDAYLRTTNPNVYAAGDVTGAPQFVYVAGYEGALAADNIAGLDRRLDLRAIPRIIFTSPQIAAVGMTEAEAHAEGIGVKVAVLPIGTSVPRAMVNGSDGVVKIVADRSTDRILGTHMAGENAGEVIQAATLAVKFNLTVTDLLDTFHGYLTMAESLKLAAQSFERDVASLSCCAS